MNCSLTVEIIIKRPDHHIDHLIYYKDDLLRGFAFKPFGPSLSLPLRGEDNQKIGAENKMAFYITTFIILFFT